MRSTRAPTYNKAAHRPLVDDMPSPILPEKAWNARAAQHLMVRAGFGVSPEKAAALARQSPEAVVDGLLDWDGPSAREVAPAWFTEAAADERPMAKARQLRREGASEESLRALQEEEQRRNRRALVETRRWWLERMLAGKDPLQEKLVLFWHGHFACSVQKVRAAWPLLAQNLMFREAGLGSWRELLLRVSQDPAMLVYLDNAISNQRGPNENYARELMELFTLGEGHYTEDDVRAAARSFTGWSLDRNRWIFAERTFLHDKGYKTFLGKSGSLDGRDVIAVLVAHPQAAPFLVEKLWRFFAGGAPTTEALADLTGVCHATDVSLRALVRALFLHPDFYAPERRRNLIKGPVQYAVHLLRACGGKMPLGDTVPKACAQLGQDLFAPPSVKGWDGGAAWITASSLAQRYQITETWLRGEKGSGRVRGEAGTFDPRLLLPDASLPREAARERLFDCLYHDPLRPEDRGAADRVIARHPPPADWTRKDWQDILCALTQSPQFQLT